MSTKSVELFHKRRATGIGGSDVGAIMGVSPWATALDVWVSKRKGGLVPVDAKESQAMMIGKLIEPTISALFTQRTGQKLRKGRFTRHREYPHMVGHPDAIIRSNKAIVEFKNVGAQRSAQFGDDGTDIVPPDYLLQVLHYMIVTEADEGWLAALIGGNEFRIYRIPFNAELARLVIEAEIKFWRSVVEGTMPHAPRTPEQALALFPIGTQPTIEADGKTMRIVESLQQCKVQLVEAQAKVDWHKTLLMQYMGEHTKLIDISNETLATWNNRSSNRIDVAELRSKHPEIAAACTRSTTSRAFLLKGEK